MHPEDPRSTSGTWVGDLWWPLLLAVGLMILAPALARAAGPEAAILPVQAEGLTQATVGIVETTMEEKMAGLGYDAVTNTEVTAATSVCASAGCKSFADAMAVGEEVGADVVVQVGLVAEDSEVVVKMVIHEVETGARHKAVERTSTSGLLSKTVKMLAAAVPDPATLTAPPPPPPPAPEPEPEPAPTPEPPQESVTEKPAVTEPAWDEAPEEEPLLATTETRDEDAVEVSLDSLRKKSLGLGISGGLLTVAGLGLAIASAVAWVDFIDWQEKAQDDQCIECLSRADEKIKDNAIMTGVAAIALIPGVILLASGIATHVSAKKVRAALGPGGPQISLSPSHLELTWSF